MNQKTLSMNFFTTYKILLIGIFLGAVAGFLYYYFVGCSGGSCQITSKPLNSSLYGAMMGGMISNIFTKSGKEKKE
jgi:phage shock protein E